MKVILEDVGPLVAVFLFCLWFGFNEYFKKQGLGFRQGVHAMLHRDTTKRAA